MLTKDRVVVWPLGQGEFCFAHFRIKAFEIGQCGSSPGHVRDEAIILFVDNRNQDDSQTQVRRVPAVFAEEESQDREAAQPGDIFIAGEGQSA